MSIEHWWPKLKPATQEWLIENNGDAVPGEVLAEIIDAGGEPTSEAGWAGERGPDGDYLSDEANDWIEAVANGERPGT